MNDLLLIGLNHKTASVEIREKLYYTIEEARPFLPELVSNNLKEGVLLSTCNRTEVFGFVEQESEHPENIINYLVEKKTATGTILPSHFYIQHSYEAARHLLEVAAGIDSLIVGEDQILKQIKDAYELATTCGTVGSTLHQLFHIALRTGKRVRSETKINEGAVSVSYAAVELSEKIFATLTNKKAMLIGAGETAELTARYLVEKGISELTIANRTKDNAERLAKEFHGKAIALEEMAEKLQEMDIVISSVNANDYILTAQQVCKARAQRTPKTLLIIDIGVPRNIDPRTKELDNVFLEDMDSLAMISQTNYERRLAEIPKVQKIIDEELHNFIAWVQSQQVTPTIKLLRDRFEEIRASEIEKNKNKFSSEELEKVDIVTKTIINKILHTPTISMKESNGQHHFDKHAMNQIVKDLFGLEKEHQ
jgi:glutamyl-tRNA reductase